MAVRKRRKPKVEIVHYEVEVNDWDLYYSFALDDGRELFDPGPYYELQLLKLNGRLIWPEDIKYVHCTVTLSAKVGLRKEKWETPPLAIGSLNAYDDRIEAYVTIPAERVSELTVVAASGKIKRVELTGTKLKWRKGLVSNVGVSTEVEDDG